MKQFYSFIALLFVSSIAFSQDCASGRYSTPVFTSVDSVMNVKYGSNIDYDGSTVDSLYMDVYTPVGDTSTNRALMILAHGGSFIGGDKGELRDLCLSYAALGYTVATINYRILPLNAAVLANPGPEFKKAVVRAVYDMKASIRYFRKSVVENGNPYGINPNLIIIGGVSAGAITANHTAYLDQESEIPSDLQNFFDTHGGLEGNSGNPGYSSLPQLDVSMCGAINDTSWMTPGSIPYVGIHTDGDPVVPNLYGQPNIGITVPVDLYGDSLMYERALNVGMTADYQMYISNQHCDFPQPQAFMFVSSFLHDQICNNSLSVEENKDFKFNMYPNPADSYITLSFKNENKGAIVQVFSMNGKLLSTQLVQNGQKNVKVSVSSLRAGTYFVRIAKENGQMSSKKFIKK